jgi:hypothetical protein
MTATYDLIASNVLTSTTASVTFSSIPTTYRDLILVVSGTMTSNNAAWLRFNSDTGANYNRIWMQGNGSTATSGSTTNATSLYVSNTDAFSSTVVNTMIVQILDYRAIDKHKSGLLRLDRSDAVTSALGFRWASTSSITSILIDGDGDYAAGTTFYLYGIVS